MNILNLDSYIDNIEPIAFQLAGNTIYIDFIPAIFELFFIQNQDSIINKLSDIQQLTENDIKEWKNQIYIVLNENAERKNIKLNKTDINNLGVIQTFKIFQSIISFLNKKINTMYKDEITPAGEEEPGEPQKKSKKSQ